MTPRSIFDGGRYSSLHRSQMYSIELEIKDTTESSTSRYSLLYSCRSGFTSTSVCDKHDDFIFDFTNLPFLSRNVNRLSPMTFDKVLSTE